MQRRPAERNRTLLIKETALEWGVDIRTSGKWLNRYGEEIVKDREKLARVLIRQQKAPDIVRTKCREVLRGSGMPAVAKELAEVTGESEEIGVQAVVAIKDLASWARKLEEHLAYQDRKLTECRTTGDYSEEQHRLKAVGLLTEKLVSVRKTQVSLGQSEGQVIAREDYCRQVRALGSRLAIGIQRVRDELRPLMTAPAVEANAILEDRLLSQLFLAPLARAAGLASPCGLPEWVTSEIISTVAGTVASGELEFAQVLKEETTNEDNSS